MRPALALQRHLDLHEHLGEGMSLTHLIAETITYEGQSYQAGVEIATAIRRHLASAETYIVESTMNAEVMRVAEFDIKPNSRFGEHISPPSPAGFIAFAEPLAIKEVMSQVQLIHAITWGPAIDKSGRRGLLISWFNDAQRQPDEVMLSYLGRDLEKHDWDPTMKFTGGWSIIQVHLVTENFRIGPNRIYPTPEKIQEVLKDGIGRPLHEGHVNLLHVALSVWRLMGETIDYGEARTETVQRAMTRRARRIGKDSSDITVVTLRRARHETSKEAKGTGEPLQWRSDVAGHWRNQAYGPRRTLRRRIWIDAHERGPEDAPKRPVKPKVMRLTR